MTALDTAAIALIEDDDVSFSLGLCREVNRIYGLYERYELAQTEQVYAGLGLAAELLAPLRRTVAEGMPVLRLEVAAAQLREMLTVMFGVAHLAPAVRATSVAAIEAQASVEVNEPAAPRSPRRRMRWSWRLGRLVAP